MPVGDFHPLEFKLVFINRLRVCNFAIFSTFGANKGEKHGAGGDYKTIN